MIDELMLFVQDMIMPENRRKKNCQKHIAIFIFSKQAFNESLEFCNRS